MNDFDLKKYLVENKLTRLSEQDEDDDFNITVDDKWGKSLEQEIFEGNLQAASLDPNFTNQDTSVVKY
jgi:hypothetical protein